MGDTAAIVKSYQTRIDNLDEELRSVKGRIRRYSTIRFLVFAAIVLSVYYIFVGDQTLPWLISAVLLTALFFYLVNKHLSIKYRQSVLDNLIRINQNEISVLNQQPSFLPDGNLFHQDLTYTADLDIFGPRTLYHLLNRCFSEPGRKKLAGWLIDPDYDVDTIQARQRAIGSVVGETGLRQEVLAHALVHFSGNEFPFKSDVPLMSSAVYGRIKLLRWILPIIILSSIVGAMITQNNNLILYGFILNLIMTGLFYKTTAKVLHRAEQNLKTLRNYNEPLKAIVQADYQDELLQDKKRSLAQAHVEFRKLQKRFDLLESRANPIVGVLLNGFLGYDFIVLSMLNKWQLTHSENVPKWLDEIAWVESVFSLATFASNNPSYTFPTLERATGISGSNIRHPFIPDEENIGNALEFTSPLKVILLTGSNMSGKSTFLRSVGVNQVLALAGSVVAADEFDTGLYGLLTSFRKSDSIQEHTSLFYDELKKLQHIIRTLDHSEKPYLILLDEILRGTNSDDKYFGSKQVLLHLKNQNAMTILATHDIALGQLEDIHGPTIQNYSFESQIIEGELHFDYKLHKGVAVNKNATFLMEKMGIIDSRIN